MESNAEFRILGLTIIPTKRPRFSLPGASTGNELRETCWAAASPRTADRVSIYAVDDLPPLTELYASLLEGAGHEVKTFNNRARALADLNVAGKKPALLITDYRGRDLPINQFMQGCRLVHPGLRILMASGLSEGEMEFSRVRQDRFIQKPFTLGELQQAVQAALDPK